MDAIKNYLETMFLNLPNTPEVQKAKYELGQMMEDKYRELIADGKTENEAIGTVIAEFGNLDELAEDLGIDSVLHHSQTFEAGRMVSLTEVKEYLKASSRHAFLIALGVLLCILSPVSTIVMSSIGELTERETFMEALGVIGMFLFIAIAVALFVTSGITMNRWEFMKHQHCSLDFATTEYVHDRRNMYRTTHAVLLSVGIIFCVLCAVPAIIMDALPLPDFIDDISGAAVLIIIAIGVFMIVLTSIKMDGFNTLLKLNDSRSMGGQYVDYQKQENYSNKTVAAIMSVYWPTISAAYLIWSFLSFEWYMTWIIWPLAAIVHKCIKNIWSD